jgi:hypothetical protein
LAVRVIQWATGSVGRTVLRRLIDHPEMEVVGVYVSNPRKVGVDAGTLVKRPETGVLATNDVEAILALDADVVIHTPLILPPYERQNEEVARLLASGKNVISTNGFYRPDIHGAGYSAPLLAAAETGNATLAGSGLNPGVIAERIAVTLSCMMARIDQIRTLEVFDASLTDSAGLLFGAMGFGVDPAKEDLRTSPIAKMYNEYYAEVLHYVANKLNTEIVDIEPRHELTFAPHKIEMKAGVIEEGCVAATTWQWFGRFANGTTMLHRILWTASHQLHGETDTVHWLVELDGRPNLRCTIELTDPDPQAPPARPPMDATAATIINLIPSVIAAPAGFFELPAVAPYRAH